MTDDVRDLAGRCVRTVIATALGTAGALVIAVSLPCSPHSHPDVFGIAGCNAVLILALACGLSIGWYAILGAARRPRLGLKLARAHVVVRPKR